MTALDSRSARLKLLSAMVLVGLAFFWPAVHQVATSVLHRQGSSHGVFIPFLSAYFIYLKYERLRRIPMHYYPPAAAASALFLITAWIGTDSLKLQFVAYIFFIASALYFCCGKPMFREVVFPIIFLMVMVPIPGDTYNAMADMTRHITFDLSLGILSILDIPFYREGWLIRLPNALLEVAISCSGIRYLISYFVFGIAYAYLFRDGYRSRLLLVAATIPISLAASTLRLTIIFLATYYISPKIAEYWPHVTLSWIIFFVILFGLITLDQHRLNRNLIPPAEGAVRTVV